MVLCNIEPNKFFPGSPKIRMTRLTEDERREVLQTVEELQGEGEDEGNVFNWIHPFERKASAEERDKHLKRLRGVQKMDQILRKMEGKATLYYHTKKCTWSTAPGSHPCGILSDNDKRWMKSWDKKNLSRYGDKRRKESSSFPSSLKPSTPHDFSEGGCIYCNGWFDDTIKSELGRTVPRYRLDGPWVE